MMVSRSIFFRTLVLVAALTALAGCGKKQASGDAVVAKIGDRTITAEYYQQMLGKMKPETLPRDKDGNPIDTATLEGKQAFLDVLVNKEVMVAKALQMGYDKDTQVEQGLQHLLDYHAMIFFWEDVIGEQAKTVSDADVDYYYSRLGEKRKCDFIVTDFESDAIKARDEARAGGDWAAIKAKYHSQYADPERETVIVVPWGQFTDNFQRAVYALEQGGVSDPVPTQYGYWVMRLTEITQDPKPSLDSIRVRVLDSIRKRKIAAAQDAFKEEVRQKHDFHIDEDALMTVYLGLPAEEHIIDPQTQKPTPRDQLRPLAVPSDQLDKELFSYKISTGPVTFSIGDYKSRFDEMNVFDRAKKAELLGSLRNKIQNEVDQILLLDDARTRGLMSDPRVVKAANRQIEEMLVEKVHNEQVSFDEQVTPQDLDSFWAEHKDEYKLPEIRDGHLVVCKDRETAVQARDALVTRAGESNIWKQVNKLYGNVPKLEREFGRLHNVRQDDDSAMGRDLLFSLQLNQMSEPTQIPEGWAVAVCEKIEPATTRELTEVSEMVGQRIRSIRKDAALEAKLKEWSDELKVTRDNKVLAQMPSYDDLKKAEDAALKPVVEKSANGAA